MNIPVFVIKLSMVLGGMGMLSYGLWWILDNSREVFGWRESLRIFGQAILVTVFIMGGVALIMFGLWD